MKRLGRKILLSLVGVLMLLGFQGTSIAGNTIRNAELKNLNQTTPLYFADAENSVAKDASDKTQWHSSHQSHQSHMSHQSHQSHYSHYSGW